MSHPNELPQMCGERGFLSFIDSLCAQPQLHAKLSRRWRRKPRKSIQTPQCRCPRCKRQHTSKDNEALNAGHPEMGFLADKAVAKDVDDNDGRSIHCMIADRSSCQAALFGICRRLFSILSYSGNWSSFVVDALNRKIQHGHFFDKRWANLSGAAGANAVKIVAVANGIKIQIEVEVGPRGGDASCCIQKRPHTSGEFSNEFAVIANLDCA
ncbi:hypothetical protein R3P38DRAFT_2815708 [Favolaschia claudopus]|uniref:Transposase n=1 Tax=Favolaschia claudopus TaxID=2862362 RepID=A0AAV9Z0U0_9AGAR